MPSSNAGVQRVVIPEIMDRDEGTVQEIDRALRDLRRINRWFGGISTTSMMLQQVAGKRRSNRLSMLDVGAGSGDVALAARSAMQRLGIGLEVTLADRSLLHLRMALPAARKIVGDASALPFASASFDLVSCSLLAHHLEPEELIAFVAQALRICRVAVLINDLRRSAVSLALVYAGFPMFCRIVRHDGAASVRRAYTIPEMRQMLERVGAGFEITPHYLFRMGAIVWKDETRN